MQIHIVSRLIEDADGPVSANTEGAFVDKERADYTARSIDQDGQPGYSVVETVELDLTGMPSHLVAALRRQYR